MISREVCQRVLQKAVATGADYAEIFAENTVNHSINMIASRVDAVKDAVIAGASVRVYKGLRSVMASTVDTSEAGLIACAEKAADALGQGDAQIDIVLKERLFGDIHPVKIVPSSVTNKEKVAVLKEGYFAAKEYDACIKQVSGTILDVDHNILIANSEGLYTQDRQIRTRISISAVADKGEGTQTGSFNPGRRMGMEMFDFIDPKAVGLRAAKQAVTMAGAGYCPAGVMPVVIGNGLGGVSSMRPAVTLWRLPPLPTARASLPASWAKRSPTKRSLPSTTAPSPAPGAPSISTTKAHPHSVMC